MTAMRAKTPAVSHQLLQVVLDCVWVNHDADSHQRVESKVKDLVAEEGDDPCSAQLRQVKDQHTSHYRVLRVINQRNVLPLNPFSRSSEFYNEAEHEGFFFYLVCAVCGHPTYKDHQQGDR